MVTRVGITGVTCFRPKAAPGKGFGGCRCSPKASAILEIAGKRWACPTARSALLAAHHQFCNGLQLHVGGTLVDLADLRIAPVLLDRVVPGKPVAPVDLDGEGGDALSHLG